MSNDLIINEYNNQVMKIFDVAKTGLDTDFLSNASRDGETVNVNIDISASFTLTLGTGRGQMEFECDRILTVHREDSEEFMVSLSSPQLTEGQVDLTFQGKLVTVEVCGADRWVIARKVIMVNNNLK